jgi:TatD DNase family protein
VSPDGVLIDSHCHPAEAARAGTFAAYRAEAEAAGVVGLVAIGTDLDDWTLYRDLAAANPGYVRHTVGLHPNHVEEGFEDTLMALGSYFADTTTPAALGEIGLDYFRLPANPAEAEAAKARQHEAFRRQLALAHELDCPVVIHSRSAFHDCVRLIDASRVDWRKVVFHCFTESVECARELSRRGGRASFTGVLTYPKSTVTRASLATLGPDDLMLETDAPYLAPQSRRGRDNHSAYLAETLATAAEILNMDPAALAAQTTANARAFFGWD